MTPAAGDPAEEASGLQAEIEVLRARLRQIVLEASANEQKWQRTREREMELLAADSLPEFLTLVTTGLATSYGLDAVRLIVEDPNHEIRHLLLGNGDRLDEFPAVSFVDTLGALAPQVAILRRPWLGNFVRADHALLFGADAELSTLALLPLRRHARTIGVLCFGSVDPERFSHRHGTDFLQHLASVVGACLENACNRVRVLRSGLSDYLTGWYNRRYLGARLREELARARRKGSTVACLMIDVDNFKLINDGYGHLGGDEALREIAARIEGQIRAMDTAARFGGDEFALLLPDTGAVDGMRLAERIQGALMVPVEVGSGARLMVTLSIGVAAVAGSGDGPELKALADRLLADADAALYRAKAAGRNRIICSDP